MENLETTNLVTKAMDTRVLNQNDVMEMLGIKRTTFFKIAKANILPLVKMGKNYYTTSKLMEEWFEKMQGKEMFW